MVEIAENKEQERESVTGQQSWGDRYKKAVFDKGTYLGLNYFVNAICSATLAYIIERRFDARIANRAEKFAQGLSSVTGVDKERLKGGVNWSFRSFFLTMAGNILIPVIKKLEDNRQRIQFGIGHMLDRLQETFGKGNAASRGNIADYRKVHDAMRSPGSIRFSDEEKDRLQTKYRLDMADDTQKPSFTEHKLAWLKVVTARAMGLLVTESAAFLIGLTNKNENKWLRNQTYEKLMSEKLEKGLKIAVPGYKRLDNAKPVGNHPAGARHFADLMYTDAVLTGVSAATHKVVQNLLHKDSVGKRKNIAKEKPKDFRAREEGRDASSTSVMTP